MKCNKCGTPIIPGEDTCRICGTKTDFTKREEEPEIIDLPEDIEEDYIELPDLDGIFDGIKIDDNQSEEVEEIDNTINDIKDVPEEKIMDIKEPKKEKNIKHIVEPVVKENKHKNKKLLEKASPKEELIKEPKKEKSGFSAGIFFVMILLLFSLAGNIYLFIMNSNAKATEKEQPTEEKLTYSKIAYDNYRITIPATWINQKNTNGILVYDETENWSANIQLIKNSNYDEFVKNKDKLAQSLGTLKYQFTSNYSKEVDKKQYYLFKGKYYNYSVYVIITEIDDKTMLAVDLKFKGEVDDILLNTILTTMATTKQANTTNLFKENFEFNNISDKIASISQKKE